MEINFFMRTAYHSPSVYLICHPARLLAPATLACCSMLCRKCASRIFDITYYNVYAAKPREPQASEGEGEVGTCLLFSIYVRAARNPGLAARCSWFARWRGPTRCGTTSLVRLPL